MRLVVILLALACVSIFAKDFYTYEEALEIQKKSNKVIMLDVVRDGCHYCEDMKKNVFQDKEMLEWINQRFIPVEINLDHDEIPLELKVYFTPTFFFLDKNQKVLKKVPGSWSIEDFKDLTKGIK
ncbi:DUF255 domain-containing protein [Sulfurimonas aquatica]|uniref:DUF255 domain-containing protein n=1 Tax=Sulfurimonas aquatica TaxID=2672570 RepID=A0A975GD52_9BACT|nr:thioredoxin fold domain-containing protein [Sulfurimonas aquatica]QSZ41993.1 DUF255 domain-containing protein [Sulfurimonas aquatica]